MFIGVGAVGGVFILICEVLIHKYFKRQEIINWFKLDESIMFNPVIGLLLLQTTLTSTMKLVLMI